VCRLTFCRLCPLAGHNSPAAYPCSDDHISLLVACSTAANLSSCRSDTVTTSHFHILTRAGADWAFLQAQDASILVFNGVCELTAAAASHRIDIEPLEHVKSIAHSSCGH
jgi:hypothetical protein